MENQDEVEDSVSTLSKRLSALVHELLSVSLVPTGARDPPNLRTKYPTRLIEYPIPALKDGSCRVHVTQKCNRPVGGAPDQWGHVAAVGTRHPGSISHGRRPAQIDDETRAFGLGIDPD